MLKNQEYKSANVIKNFCEYKPYKQHILLFIRKSSKRASVYHAETKVVPGWVIRQTFMTPEGNFTLTQDCRHLIAVSRKMFVQQLTYQMINSRTLSAIFIMI